jgi:hypothetical protein
MIVGCKSVNLVSSDCDSCQDIDHRIEVSDAVSMITDFHNIFNLDRDGQNSNRISNLGGVIDLRTWNPSSVIFGFTPLKMHYGYTPINKQLTLTIENDNDKCYRDKYTGKEGIESATLLTNTNTIPALPNQVVTPEEVYNYLQNNTFQQNPLPVSITNLDARTLLRDFTCNFGSDYLCPDIHFYPRTSTNEISSENNFHHFAYFFGYNSAGGNHKIRVILVGVNENNRLMLVDSENNSLMRDYSRPYPVASSPIK